jgi:hypothetical protein
MDYIIEQIEAWLVALAFAGAMLGSWGLGWRYGRRLSPEPGEDPGSKFIDASIALLGLLLAFTFAIALGRYDQRRLAVIAESTAIGDFYTCASLLKEPLRTKLQDVIRNYAQDQLKTPQETLYGEDEKKATERCQKSYAEMTDIVGKAIAEGTPIANPLTNTLNNVTTTAASRLAAFQVRLPWSIVGLLFLSSVVPAFLIGEKQGTTHKIHFSGSVSFIVLVTLVIFVILDLNQPRRGIIRVSHSSLETVIQSMAR